MTIKMFKPKINKQIQETIAKPCLKVIKHILQIKKKKCLQFKTDQSTSKLASSLKPSQTLQTFKMKKEKQSVFKITAVKSKLRLYQLTGFVSLAL